VSIDTRDVVYGRLEFTVQSMVVEVQSLEFGETVDKDGDDEFVCDVEGKGGKDSGEEGFLLVRVLSFIRGSFILDLFLSASMIPTLLHSWFTLLPSLLAYNLGQLSDKYATSLLETVGRSGSLGGEFHPCAEKISYSYSLKSCSSSYTPCLDPISIYCNPINVMWCQVINSLNMMWDNTCTKLIVQDKARGLISGIGRQAAKTQDKVAGTIVRCRAK
jgi:hypothetical protein